MPISCLVFDLDETLIYGDFHKDDTITLKIRPYCEEFLDYCFTNFNIGIWTMANASWANTVLENILTEKQKEQVYFIYTSQNACPRTDGDIKCLNKIYSKKKYKDIFNNENTLMIDDKYHNMIENVHNGIIIPEFHGETNDRALLALMEHLKKYKNRPATRFPKNINWANVPTLSKKNTKKDK